MGYPALAECPDHCHSMPSAATISMDMQYTKYLSIHDHARPNYSMLYPVISRRSKGLSLGINLFPDAKRCTFDCPYCEVHPFEDDLAFSPAGLESELQKFFHDEYPRYWQSMPLKDICLSGNGEPSLSPYLKEALAICAKVRKEYFSCKNVSDSADRPEMLLITNATGFLNPGVSEVLHEFVKTEGLVIWAKLDSGSKSGFLAMSRSAYVFSAILDGIASFAKVSPIVIQTMLCSLRGLTPQAKEAREYAATIDYLVELGSKIEEIHLYTVARTPLEPWVGSLEDAKILEFIETARSASKFDIPMYGFGAHSQGPLEF